MGKTGRVRLVVTLAATFVALWAMFAPAALAQAPTGRSVYREWSGKSTYEKKEFPFTVTFFLFESGKVQGTMRKGETSDRVTGTLIDGKLTLTDSVGEKKVAKLTESTWEGTDKNGLVKMTAQAVVASGRLPEITASPQPDTGSRSSSTAAAAPNPYPVPTDDVLGYRDNAKSVQTARDPRARNVSPDEVAALYRKIAIIGLLAFLFVTVPMVVGMWRLFVKAGEPGWAALVPIYNHCILLKMCGKPMWWVALGFIPFVGGIASLFVWIVVCAELPKYFGKDQAFGLGLFFLPFVFFPWLGFDDSDYSSDVYAS